MHWKWPITVCFFAILVGVLHGMTHLEFYELYTQLLTDIDKLFELTADYVASAVVKLGFSRNSNKLLKVAEHYDLMVKRARPLITLCRRDLRALIIFINSLDSVHMIKKFLYSYFRQSAINLIDHLKRVYELP